MVVSVEAPELLALSLTVLLLLLNSHEALSVANSADSDDGDSSEEDFTGEQGYLLGEGDCSTLAALHHVRMLSIFSIVGEDLGFWVRPRSTTWFSYFVVEEFEDDRWIQCF
jgi:hypothetical protein